MYKQRVSSIITNEFAFIFAAMNYHGEADRIYKSIYLFWFVP